MERPCLSSRLPERSGPGDRQAGTHRPRHAQSAGRGRFEVQQALHAGDSGIADEFITLARVLKTQGRRGEVAAEPHSDVPDRFQPGHAAVGLAEGWNGPRRELKIEELWPHKGYLVLKFEGVDSISEAETLIGCELQVPASERAQLEPGWTYVSDLVGCTVFDGDREIGRVARRPVWSRRSAAADRQGGSEESTRFRTRKRI